MEQKKKWMGSKECDFCSMPLHKSKWFVDGVVKGLGGTWALMCDRCFPTMGAGIGQGVGQKYDGKTLEKLEG